MRTHLGEKDSCCLNVGLDIERLVELRAEALTAPIPELAPVTMTVFPNKWDALKTILNDGGMGRMAKLPLRLTL